MKTGGGKGNVRDQLSKNRKLRSQVAGRFSSSFVLLDNTSLALIRLGTGWIVLLDLSLLTAFSLTVLRGSPRSENSSFV